VISRGVVNCMMLRPIVQAVVSGNIHPLHKEEEVTNPQEIPVKLNNKFSFNTLSLKTSTPSEFPMIFNSTRQVWYFGEPNKMCCSRKYPYSPRRDWNFLGVGAVSVRQKNFKKCMKLIYDII